MIGKASDAGKGFVYEEAPPRGWQEGRKDFSHKVRRLSFFWLNL